MVSQNVPVLKILQLMNSKKDDMEKIISVLQLQADCFEKGTFDDEEYDKLQSRVDKYIEQMNQLNEETDQVMSGAANDISEAIKRKLPEAEEIRKLIETIKQLAKVIDQTIAKNKESLERFMANERKEIGNRRAQRRSAATYYKNMTRQMDAMSYLYDKSN